MKTRTYDVVATLGYSDDTSVEVTTQVELETSEIWATYELYCITKFEAVIHELGLALLHRPNVVCVDITDFTKVPILEEFGSLWRLQTYLFGCFCFGPCSHRYDRFNVWFMNSHCLFTATLWVWRTAGLPLSPEP